MKIYKFWWYFKFSIENIAIQIVLKHDNSYNIT